MDLTAREWFGRVADSELRNILFKNFEHHISDCAYRKEREQALYQTLYGALFQSFSWGSAKYFPNGMETALSSNDPYPVWKDVATKAKNGEILLMDVTYLSIWI